LGFAFRAACFMPSHQFQPADRDSGSTSRTLLGRLRADDAAAWRRLVTLYAPLVHHWCLQMGLPPREAGDVLQEVFQSVAANISRFRRDQAGDTFRGWLRTITRHKVTDHFRKRMREPEAAGGTEAQLWMNQFPAPDLAGSESVSLARPERALLQRALELIRGEFEERTWKAFWRMAVEDQSAADVAAELSMSPGAVRVAKCRVLQRLREELGETSE
jgi:RNA polymerase sigma-70 factor (ECF subfamily)